MRALVPLCVGLVVACGGPGSSSRDDDERTSGGSGVGEGGGESTGSGSQSDRSATDADVLDAQALAGPFDAVADFCDQLEPGVECNERDVFAVGSVPEPYLAVEMFTIIDRDSRVEYCEVGVQLERGWYATIQHQVCSMKEPRSAGEVTAVSFAKHAEGPPVIRVAAHVEGRTDHGSTEEDTVVLCGVGASNIPKCTDAIVTYRYVLDREGAEDEHELSVEVLPDGTVKLSGELDGDRVDSTMPVPF